jgi:hypothetical protein
LSENFTLFDICSSLLANYLLIYNNLINVACFLLFQIINSKIMDKAIPNEFIATHQTHAAEVRGRWLVVVPVTALLLAAALSASATVMRVAGRLTLPVLWNLAHESTSPVALSLVAPVSESR